MITLRNFLNAYAEDLKFWTTLESGSVNAITAGTPDFANSDELEDYRKELDILIEALKESEDAL